MHLLAACLLAAAVMAMVVRVDGHSAWLCPKPRSPSTGLKDYPCGRSVFNKWDGPWTSVAPGKLTVSWHETINHNGAPYRIALSLGSGPDGLVGDCTFEDVVLADHIPHWDMASSDKTYYFTVDIPNVDAPFATLQLLNPMTDKLMGTSCSTIGNVDDPECFSVYHSCASISITGTTPVADFLASYTYTTPPGLPAPPTPNAWSKGESGTWTNGWLQGQSTTVHGDACTESTAPANWRTFHGTCADCGYPSTCGVDRPPSPPAPPPPPGSTSSSGSTSSGSSTASGNPAQTQSPSSTDDDKVLGMSRTAFGGVLAGIVIVIVVIGGAVAFIVHRARSSASSLAMPAYQAADTDAVALNNRF
ncbi:uncharacterized protein AMSG_12126 [Thecamonas trahens ATCC 50062]|uniref:Chitin-binding type-4 domain-containing protein n=1 Tax=Thecamonas trahens ATCC 50062 TaxID=461836 RepID=A0A0L0DJU0_THETB|nr:hypothetical protein AMSG_12126 [Thecamonas trahens ATCC 50062]KNC52480.1 hypothetical protein AMSG_12126 [Thecamonas trahens ATCC 50062]|eukprot:XP_013755369.1 hypothetical protein AMSG_12126 [Thecamonas trahens ATCC 50062]